jgi:tartrate-resistant acid phosphatase type 5
MLDTIALDRRRALKTLFCSSAAMMLQLRDREARAHIVQNATHVLMIGDFGTGGKEQSKVADAMKTFVANSGIRPDSMFLLGDNFYGKDSKGFSVDSTRWKNEIEEMYPSSSFPGSCWAVLGNHDYHDNKDGEQVQLAYAKQAGTRFKLPSKWYRFEIGTPSPMVTVLAIDTNFPAVSGGKQKSGKWPKACLSEDDVQQQLEWLDAELAKPRAPFTTVLGHHPLYSNGSHGDVPVLIESVGKLLTKHKVHAYFCGHDHDLQHLELENLFTSFVLSGGGGAKVRKMNRDREMPFGKEVNGFTHMQIESDALTITHHGVDLTALHRFRKSLDGSISIV